MCGITTSAGPARSCLHTWPTCGASWPAPDRTSSIPSVPSATSCGCHAQTIRGRPMMRRPKALLKVLPRAQLRFKVMAGVVVVTLVALVAFDVGAVTTMRRYLLTQTDSNLHGALTLALPRLAATLALTHQVVWASNHAVPSEVVRPSYA